MRSPIEQNDSPKSIQLEIIIKSQLVPLAIQQEVYLTVRALTEGNCAADDSYEYFFIHELMTIQSALETIHDTSRNLFSAQIG